MNLPLNTDLTGKVAVVTGAAGTLCSIFSKTVQDNTKRFFTNFVCFLSDTDSTFCCCEGLMSRQETETVSILFQQHLAQVTMAKTYLTGICNGTGDTECL